MKEQTRSTEVQINEEEIGKQPENDFRIMIVKLIKNLESKMKKMQESINKELDELRNKHTETNNTILNDILARYNNLGCVFFPFNTLNIFCHSLLVFRISAERPAVKHMGFPFYVTCCFSLAALNILSLCLVFVSLISMYLVMFLLGFILFVTLCASWT